MPKRSEVLGKLLALTKTSTLADARKAFRDAVSAEARTEVVLANADSIAWLISEMGRQLDPLPAAIPLPPPRQAGLKTWRWRKQAFKMRRLKACAFVFQALN